MNYYFQVGHYSGELFVDEICRWNVETIPTLVRKIDLVKLIQNEVLPKYMRAELEQHRESWFREFDAEIVAIKYENNYFTLQVVWRYCDEQYSEAFDLRFQPIDETKCLAKYLFDTDQKG